MRESLLVKTNINHIILGEYIEILLYCIYITLVHRNHLYYIFEEIIKTFVLSSNILKLNPDLWDNILRNYIHVFYL